MALDPRRVVGVESEVDRRALRRRAGDGDRRTVARARTGTCATRSARTSRASASSSGGGRRVGVQVALAVADDADLRRDVEAPRRAPSTSSVEPPPMSITRYSLGAVARASRRRRSAAPPRRRSAIRAAKPSASLDPRGERGAVGGVAHGRGHHRAAPRSRAPRSRRGSRASTSSTRCCGASPSRPLRSTPSPSRVTIDSRASSRAPSAISSRVEFVPMSTAATGSRRRVRHLLARRARRAGCRRPCRPSASGCGSWPSRRAARRAGSARVSSGSSAGSGSGSVTSSPAPAISPSTSASRSATWSTDAAAGGVDQVRGRASSARTAAAPIRWRVSGVSGVCSET